MNKTDICFSANRSNVEVAFRDYMNTYLGETEKRTGYTYDNSVKFAEKEAKMNKLMNAEIYKLANIEFSEGSMVSKEMWAQHPLVKWASFAVANSLIDMVLPDILDKSIGLYTEQKNGMIGDSFAFEVEPNDLFYVSKAGRDQRTVEFQRQYNGQVTVIPENRAISVAVNFYRVLCGLDSLAKFVMKAILSVEAQITREVYKAFDTAMGGLPTTPIDGNLKVAGWSKPEALRLAQTVTAYNGGAKAIFLGTATALAAILPDDANYRYEIDSEFVKVGYVRTAFGYDTMVLPQIADYRNPYKLSIRDDVIYVISPSTQKLVKLCYEGSSTTNSITAFQTANLTESTTINKSYGVAIATNAIAGEITLA